MRLGPRARDVHLAALAGGLGLRARREEAGHVEPDVERRRKARACRRRPSSSGRAQRARARGHPGLEGRRRPPAARRRAARGNSPAPRPTPSAAHTSRSSGVSMPSATSRNANSLPRSDEELQDRAAPRVLRDAARDLAVHLDPLGLEGVAELERAVPGGDVVERDHGAEVAGHRQRRARDPGGDGSVSTSTRSSTRRENGNAAPLGLLAERDERVLRALDELGIDVEKEERLVRQTPSPPRARRSRKTARRSARGGATRRPGKCRRPAACSRPARVRAAAPRTR